MINKLITSILPYMPQKLVWVFSKKYIAGETIGHAIQASKKLNEENIYVTIDLLGEFIETMDQADFNKNEYLNIIEAFEKAKIKGNYSLKPTSFGLLIDEDKCYENIRSIVELASKYNSFVRIDMEDSVCVDLEMSLYKRLKDEFPMNVGLVLQAYLYRTEKDIDEMLKWHTSDSPLNFRLVKGIYNEPEEIAIKDFNGINDNFLRLLDKLMLNGIYVGIATHDKQLIEGSKAIIDKYNVSDDKYEYQMLYGVTPDLRSKIVSDNKKMRIYVPFGKDWFGYCIRRLKENPQMTKHIIKSIFVKG